MIETLNNDWGSLLEKECQKEYYLQLQAFLQEEYQGKTIFPDKEDVFSALHLTSFEDTKVAIIGQDPYHGIGQAHGLSFSVKPGITIPPSLKNVYKELHEDIGCYIPNHGYLVHWAQQGVLLLNTVLTVQAHSPNSHKGKGWEVFTDEIITTLNQRDKPVVFILWGKHAQLKKDLITENRHPIIASPHPSPFSANRGFFGSKPFSKVNDYLKEMGNSEIDWQIENI